MKIDSILISEDEIVVKKDDFGYLVEHYIRGLLRHNPYVADGPHGTDARLREWWPQLEEYYRRHIQRDIEVAIELDKYPAPPHSDRGPLQNKELWIQFLQDFRPGKSPYTVDYSCSKCKAKNVKLWRDYQTFADHVELECASCLAPDQKVDENGMAEYHYEAKMASGEPIPPTLTDQIKGKIPAVPVGDTYWSYTSVPSQDVEWWKALPTYPKGK